MVVHNSFKTERLPKDNTDDLVLRAQIADSIRHALAPYGIGKNGWRCTAYDESGNLQEITSDSIGEVHTDIIVDPEEDAQCVDDPLLFNLPTDSECPATQKTSRPRIQRSIRRRGRSMLPCDASRFPAAPYPLPAPVAEVASDVDDEPLPKKKQANVFMISETAKVTAFITSRLKRMQQLADKKIAKAWIKGICPKKQAKFPYQNKGKDDSGREKREKTLIPGWWPDTETVCRFIEPDHIKRDERMKLCLHLLRLRPSPDQLRAWNQDKSEPHPTHVMYGWTAFLKELAGIEIFEDLPKEDKTKTAQRQKLMLQMYEVAEMEEDYLNDGLDPEHTFQWEEDDEDRKTLAIKRTRQASISSDTARDSRASSVSVTCSKPKKARRDSMSDASTILPFKPDVDMLDESAVEGFCGQELTPGSAPCDISQSSSRRDAVGTRPRQSNAFIDSAPVMKRSSSISSQATDHTMQWSVAPGNWPEQPCTSSFGSNSGHFISPGYPDQNQSIFPGRHECEFPQLQQQDMVQVHHVHHVPEPHFQSNANTAAVYSHANMAPMPLTGYVPPHCEIPRTPACTTTMPPSQYFMPAGSDPAVADFHPPMAAAPRAYHQDPQYGLAERHIAPMQYHGLPQQTEWAQPLYHHHHRS